MRKGYDRYYGRASSTFVLANNNDGWEGRRRNRKNMDDHALALPDSGSTRRHSPSPGWPPPPHSYGWSRPRRGASPCGPRLLLPWEEGAPERGLHLRTASSALMPTVTASRLGLGPDHDGGCRWVEEVAQTMMAADLGHRRQMLERCDRRCGRRRNSGTSGSGARCECFFDLASYLFLDGKDTGAREEAMAAMRETTCRHPR